MRFTFVASLIGITLAMTGCVTPAQRQAKQARVDAAMPVCMTDRQCDAQWAAAQTWVSQHCGMKIQTSNDVLIETYGSPPNSTSTACRVNKQKAGKHGAVLQMWAGCSNMFGCIPSWDDQLVAFGEYVKAAGAAYEPLKIGVMTQVVGSNGQAVYTFAEAAGVRITSVNPGGRADMAGLRTDDVIKSFNDIRIRSLDDWTEALDKVGPGDVVHVGVRRAGQDVIVDMPL